MSSILKRFLAEIGIRSIIESPFDTKLLCLQRFVRMFAYGASALILVVYLSTLGISDAHIGLFMTLTLLGDVVISFLLTLFADGLGRKNILMLGAALMILAGLVFALSENYWILVSASIIGVISPSGFEIGPFRAIEESTLAQLSAKDIRSDIFAWYALIGTFGSSLGMITCGWVVDKLQHTNGWSRVDSYRVMFWVYSALGLIKFFLAMMLSKKCESERQASEQRPTPSTSETQPLLGDSANTENPNYATHASIDGAANAAKPAAATEPPPTEVSKTKSKLRSLLPTISPTSRGIVLKLSVLFAVDSFASGLVTTTWLTYFFTRKFGLAEGVLGTLFFVATLVAATSNLLAASIARRIGPVKTMVFTHMPSSIALALIPAPSDVRLAMMILILRSCTSNMDTAPRQAFLAAAVLSTERTAVMGVVNVIKTLAQSGGPSVTGALAGTGKFWVAFVLAGCLKVSYDLGILTMFVGFKGREDDETEPIVNPAAPRTGNEGLAQEGNQSATEGEP